MGPRHDLSFCACKTAFLASQSLVSMGPSPHLWFCAFKRATLGPELHVSIDPIETINSGGKHAVLHAQIHR